MIKRHSRGFSRDTPAKAVANAMEAFALEEEAAGIVPLAMRLVSMIALDDGYEADVEIQCKGEGTGTKQPDDHFKPLLEFDFAEAEAQGESYLRDKDWPPQADTATVMQYYHEKPGNIGLRPEEIMQRELEIARRKHQWRMLQRHARLMRGYRIRPNDDEDDESGLPPAPAPV